MPLLLSAGAAVHGPVAFGEEAPTAEGIPFPAVDTSQDLRAYLPVSGKDGGHRKELIRPKMELCGTTNFSAYLRKMAIDGYAVNRISSILNAQ